MEIGDAYGANLQCTVAPNPREVIQFQKDWYNKLEEMTKFIIYYNKQNDPLLAASFLSDIWRSSKNKRCAIDFHLCIFNWWDFRPEIHSLGTIYIIFSC